MSDLPVSNVRVALDVDTPGRLALVIEGLDVRRATKLGAHVFGCLDLLNPARPGNIEFVLDADGKVGRLRASGLTADLRRFLWGDLLNTMSRTPEDAERPDAGDASGAGAEDASAEHAAAEGAPPAGDDAVVEVADDLPGWPGSHEELVEASPGDHGDASPEVLEDASLASTGDASPASTGDASVPAAEDASAPAAEDATAPPIGTRKPRRKTLVGE